MFIIKTDHFNLEEICESGQCFRMKKLGDGSFCVIAGDFYLKAYQKEDQVFFDCDEQEYETFWKEYFDLGTDYQHFIDRINPNDHYLLNACRCGDGVRILKQDLWEMIVTFLISQQNNIKRIGKCIELICETYGKRCVSKDGEIYYGFPTAESLKDLPEDALMACNLGYRSKYVVRTARAVCDGTVDLDAIRSMKPKQAKEQLLLCYGIGEKVADCIALFSLHDLNAFPVDTHIRQVMDAHYKRGFPNRRYHGFRGVLQQYIFYYELHKNKDEGGRDHEK